MPYLRCVLLGLLACLAISAASTATAEAEPSWVVNGKLVKLGEEKPVGGSVRTLRFRWQEAGTNEVFRVACTAAAWTGVVLGNGRDRVNTLTYAGCSLTQGPAGCVLAAGGVVALNLPWASDVVRRAGGFVDYLVIHELSITTQGCTSGTLNRTWNLTGNVGAQMSNSGSIVDVDYPTTEEEGDSFENEGTTALMSGEGEVELEGGGRLEIGEESEGGGGSAGGPLWLGPAGLLGSGETMFAQSRNLGNFTLKPSTGPVVVCTGLSAPTTLLGGATGKSDTEIAFSGCTVESHAKCDALSVGGAPGNITVKALDELVYDGSKTQAEKEEAPLGDLFTTDESAFATLIFRALETGACPSGAVETAVTGSVVGEVEPVNAMSVQGMLTFPKTAIKKVYRWKGVSVKPEEVTAGLKAFGFTATESGLADIELESGSVWGALTA